VPTLRIEYGLCRGFLVAVIERLHSIGVVAYCYLHRQITNAAVWIGMSLGEREDGWKVTSVEGDFAQGPNYPTQKPLECTVKASCPLARYKSQT